MTPLRQRMTEELQRRDYSRATVESYILAVKEFAEYFGKSPALLGSEDVRRYQLYLINGKRLAPQTVKVHMSALPYKHFYSGGQGEIAVGRAEKRGRVGAGGALPAWIRFLRSTKPGNAPAVPSLPFPDRVPPPSQAHLGRAETWPAATMAHASITGECRHGRVAALAARGDPSPCSARFPDGAGCDRQGAVP
jgi:hypothetical protein